MVFVFKWILMSLMGDHCLTSFQRRTYKRPLPVVIRPVITTLVVFLNHCICIDMHVMHRWIFFFLNKNV